MAAALMGCRRTAPSNVGPELDQLIAKRNYQQALRLVDQGLHSSPSSSAGFWDLALRKAKILESLNRREEALAWLRPLQKLPGAASAPALPVLAEQGAIERDLGQYATANRDQSRGRQLALSTGTQKWVANFDIRLAETFARLGQPTEAESALDEADQYERDHHDTSLVPYILNYRGLTRGFANRFEEALPPLNEALRLARERKLGLQVPIMINEAWCHYHLGNLERAEALYKEALPLATEDKRHEVLGHLGNIRHEAADFTGAADFFRQAAVQARGRSQEYYAMWLFNWAVALCDQGRWTEAERVNTQSIEARKAVQGAAGPSFETINAARIEAHQGHPDAAEKLYRQVMSSPSTDSSAVLDANERLADLFVATGRPDAARHQFQDSLKIADTRRSGLHEDENKLTYLSRLADLNQSYVEFLASRGEHEAAFLAAASSRARLLRDRLNQQPEVASTRPVAEYEAAARASGTTYLAFWIAPEKSYLWEITGTGFRAIPLPAEKDIRALVQRYQAGLEKDRALDPAAGRRLFDLLLGAVKPSPARRYVIVPDGPLFGLNLETLPAGADGHYWIEDATVMVTPSLDLLLTPHSGPPATRRLLLVGDAAEWDDAFPRLPYAQREMQGVRKNFPAAGVEMLSGPAASPAAYRRDHPERYDFIHFAAHATASRDAPLDSSIVLSREGQQGKLSVRDLLGMHTNAQLVTLSACRSAGARTYAGEGLVGLAWAFLQSGASNVIAGLWDVSDYSSPRLMESLYRGLAAGRPPSVALRAAKLELIHDSKFSHPFYWGAFQLYAGARERETSPTHRESNF